MNRSRALGASCTLMLLCAGMVGCKPQASTSGDVLGSSDAGYCTPFPTSANTAPADPGGVFEDCVHRWSYALAPGRDDASTVAAAVVSACGTALSHWNEQAFDQAGNQAGDQAGPAGPPASATSLTTGQPEDQMTVRSQYAQSRALFYVVQARAGRCAPPPAKSLPPPG